MPLSFTTSSELLQRLLKLPEGSSSNVENKFACNLCCFVQSRESAWLRITLLPASLSDAQRLQAFEESQKDCSSKSTAGEDGPEKEPEAPCFPVFIIECSQAALQLQTAAKPLDVTLNFTFPHLSSLVAEKDHKPGWLFDAVVEQWVKAGTPVVLAHRELSFVCMTTQELFLGAYIQSVYASLQRGVTLSKQSISWAIGLCDLSVTVPVDMSTFLSAVCFHCRAVSSKGKGTRPTSDSPFVDAEHSVSLLPPEPSETAHGLRSHRQDRLTQRTLERALLPSDLSSSRASDWSQESDTATDTDHSSMRSLPSLCQTHQVRVLML